MCVKKHVLYRRACIITHSCASEGRENKIEKLRGGVSRIAAVGRAKGGKLCVQKHEFCLERHGLYSVSKKWGGIIIIVVVIIIWSSPLK